MEAFATGERGMVSEGMHKGWQGKGLRRIGALEINLVFYVYGPCEPVYDRDSSWDTDDVPLYCGGVFGVSSEEEVAPAVG